PERREHVVKGLHRRRKTVMLLVSFVAFVVLRVFALLGVLGRRLTRAANDERAGQERRSDRFSHGPHSRTRALTLCGSAARRGSPKPCASGRRTFCTSGGA